MNDELLKDYVTACYKFIEFCSSMDRNIVQPLNNMNSINMFFYYMHNNNVSYELVIFTRSDYGITKFEYDISKLNFGNKSTQKYKNML